MPDKIENILAQIAHAFNGVTGIDAIVLGGSRATGTANEASDIDIGIYYDKVSFDLSSFKQKAASLDDEHRNDAITDPGAWGPWINGGGWQSEKEIFYMLPVRCFGVQLAYYKFCMP